MKDLYPSSLTSISEIAVCVKDPSSGSTKIPAVAIRRHIRKSFSGGKPTCSASFSARTEEPSSGIFSRTLNSRRVYKAPYSQFVETYSCRNPWGPSRSLSRCCVNARMEERRFEISSSWVVHRGEVVPTARSVGAAMEFWESWAERSEVRARIL